MNRKTYKGTIIINKPKPQIKSEETLRYESNYKQNLESITKDLSNFEHKHITVLIKPIEIEYKILIESHYEKSSPVNQTSKTIVFTITIGKLFPKTAPRLTCHTNFVFPSMFDNRNYIKDISGYSVWNNYTFSSIIIKDIPELIGYYLHNISNSIYSFVGEYKLNYNYAINDFVLNYHNALYKIQLNSAMCYVVLTDLALVFFNPSGELSEKGLCEIILEIKDIKTLSLIDEDNLTVTLKIIIHFKSDPKLIEHFDKIVIVFNKVKYNQFESKVNHRIALIKKTFSFFQKEKIAIVPIPLEKNTGEGIEEIIKYKEILIVKYDSNISSSNPKITEEIKAKEKQNKELMQKDLIDLYQKAIEIYSTEDKTKFNQYVQKLKQLLELII